MGLQAAGGFLPPVVARLLGESDQFTAEMMKARGEMSATAEHGSSSFGKLATLGKAAFLALGTAAIGIGTEAIHMADDFEGAHARLETAIHNSGSSFDEWKGQIDSTDKQLEKLGFTNTDTQDSLAKLTNVTHNTGRALKDVSLAADIARGRHIDLASASQILVKVESGHVAMLGKLGINVKDATGAVISQDAAMQKLTALYGGNAQAYAQTFAGKMEVLKATVTDLGTQLGLWLIPKVEAVASALSATIHWLDDNRAAAYALGIVVGGTLVTAIGSFLALETISTLQSIASNFSLVSTAAQKLLGWTVAGTTASAANAAAKTAETAATVASGTAAETSATFHWLGVAALEGEAAAAQAAAVAQGELAAAETAGAGGGLFAGIGAAATGLAAIALVAAPVVTAIGGIAYGLKKNADNAKEAREQVDAFVKSITDGMDKAADPTRRLNDALANVAQEQRKTEAELQTATGDRRIFLEFALSQEGKAYKKLADLKKSLDDKATTDHAHAVAQQSADAAKAIAKEKLAVQTGLDGIAALYGRHEADLLKAGGFTSKMLSNISSTVSSAVSTTQGAIRGFGNILDNFDGKTKVTGKQIIDFLHGTLDKTMQWQGDIKKLIKDGIDRGLIEQLIQAGPKSETEVKGILDAVAHGGKDTINLAIHQQRDLLNSTSQLIGDTILEGETAWKSAQEFYRTHPLNANFVISVTGSGATIFNQSSGVYHAPGHTAQHASGGLLGEGRWSVAENMPELVDPSGWVHSGAETARMMRGGGGNTTINLDLRGSVGLDEARLGRVFEDILHRHSERNGGVRIKVRN